MHIYIYIYIHTYTGVAEITHHTDFIYIQEVPVVAKHEGQTDITVLNLAISTKIRGGQIRLNVVTAL